MPSPYDQCPAYETDHFSLRLVAESDAADLLKCYSDPAAVGLMNADNCSSDFHFTSLAEMESYIRFWLRDYANRGYVRFTIIDRRLGGAIGTIEIFGRPSLAGRGRVGVLRLDLCAAYEQEHYLTELLQLAIADFYGAFTFDCLITKAIPEATARTKALEALGFTRTQDPTVVRFDNYYIR